MKSLESAVMHGVWSIYLVVLILQVKVTKCVYELSEILDLYKLLIKLIANIRKNVEIYEKRAQKISTVQQYEKDIRRKKKKKSNA